MEQTLSIIKPDAVAKNVIGEIYSRFENAGFKIVASKMIHLDNAMASGFYAVHQERPFFNDLVTFMTSGPVMVQVLEGDNAVLMHREIMGATNPKEADTGTIELTLLNLWMKMQCMALIHEKMQKLKLPISLAMMVFVRELDKHTKEKLFLC